MKRIWCLLLLSAYAVPAYADVTAVYEGAGSAQAITVEIDAAGNARVSPKAGRAYSLWRDGENYTVLQTQEATIVDRSSDLASVMGEIQGSDAQRLRATTTAPKITLVPHGAAAVRGRAGMVYVARLPSGWTDTRPMMVISKDPKLAGLGAALARHFAVGRTMVRQATGADSGPAAEFERVLKTGAPLRFYTMELLSVSYEAIPASRFALPIEPESREQILKRVHG